MHGRSSDQPPQQWSVHAQFTISHPGIEDPNSTPDAHTEQSENGVRMFYTWPPKPNSTAPNLNEESSATAATDPGKFTNAPSYGFQRGNLTFTSTPPKKPLIGSESNPSKPNTTGCAQDSGYTSIPSSNPYAGINFNRIPQNSNRKCKSTCSIILSTTINEQPELEDATQSIPQQTCGRTQSLRCQTIAPKLERPSNFYGCGDPWCYHSAYGDEASTSYSPVQESEESYSTGQTVIKRPQRGNTFATSDYYKKSNLELKGIWEPENRQKDASVQTLEMVDKCTSPFLTVDKFRSRDQQKDKKKKSVYNSRSKTEPLFGKKRSPICFTPDSLDSQQSERSTSQIYENQSAYSDKKSETSTINDSNKKPRTVHIDVYCTGTEQESEGSSSEAESKTSAQPQTVFNSDKVRITHSRSDDKDIMPMNFRKQLPLLDSKRGIKATESKSKFGNESDYGDNSSSAYPSQISSYSAMPNLSSFASTVPSSWSTYSMNTSLDNDYDSVVNTSWKDTFSDIDSLNPSRSSIAQTDSLDFVPKRFATYEKSDNLDEIARKNPESSSVASLNPSDSFEYENSEDRFRIREMEQMWNKPKNSKFPQLDQKHLLQQQKLKAYVEKRLNSANLTKLDSKDSDSESDCSEKGWSFVKEEDDKKLQRNVTVRRPSRNGESENIVQMVAERNSFPQTAKFVKSPSVAALQQKLLLNPRLRAPFMVVPGIYTNQRNVAKKFGSVVDVFRKPGHHIGPAKNPVCQCDHCKSYFENLSRNRTLSVGEIPMNNPWMNWRNTSKNS